MSEHPEICMLNPSKADAYTNDPTVRRCIGYALAWDMNPLIVVNLFALKSTSPAALYAHPYPVGGYNDEVIEKAVQFANGYNGIVVAAWGAHGKHMDRGKEIRNKGYELHALGLTSKGEPKHPLYLPKDATPFLLEAA